MQKNNFIIYKVATTRDFYSRQYIPDFLYEFQGLLADGDGVFELSVFDVFDSKKVIIR